MATCYIFAAGSFYGLVETPVEGDFVIAADAGLKYCRDAWVVPDIILGDFDSLGAVPEGENVLRLPVEKDDTDTIYAMRTGLERGYTDFVIYGGMGGSRADHTIANLQGLLFLASHGAHGRMYGDGVVWSVLHNEEICFPEGCSGTLSLFCMDGAARGVTIRGLKYELSGAELRSDFPVGVSNSFTGAAASVSVADGTLIMTHDIFGEAYDKI